MAGQDVTSCWTSTPGSARFRLFERTAGIDVVRACTSISPGAQFRLGRRSRGAGSRYLDAPVPLRVGPCP